MWLSLSDTCGWDEAYLCPRYPKKVDQWSKNKKEKPKSQEKEKKKKKVGGVLPRERAVDPPPVRQHPVGVT